MTYRQYILKHLAKGEMLCVELSKAIAEDMNNPEGIKSITSTVSSTLSKMVKENEVIKVDGKKGIRGGSVYGLPTTRTLVPGIKGWEAKDEEEAELQDAYLKKHVDRDEENLDEYFEEEPINESVQGEVRFIPTMNPIKSFAEKFAEKPKEKVTVTMDEIREEVRKHIGTDKFSSVMGLMGRFEIKRILDLKTEDFNSFYEELKKI